MTKRETNGKIHLIYDMKNLSGTFEKKRNSNAMKKPTKHSFKSLNSTMERIRNKKDTILALGSKE